MPKLAVEDVLFFVGSALTIVLLVLDKAGKLKGPMLLVLLAIAAMFMLPVALGNSWVVDAPSPMLKFSRALLLLMTVGMAYSLLAVWVSTDEAPRSKERPTVLPGFAEVRLDLANLKGLYVNLSQIAQERRAAYIDMFAAYAQYASDANSNDNPSFNAQERDFLRSKIGKDEEKLSAARERVYEIEERLAKLLALITLALPEDQGSKGLITAAATKPIYQATGLGSREWRHDEWRKWLRVQEPIMTQSVREQSTYPLEALARYVNGVINTYEKRP